MDHYNKHKVVENPQFIPIIGSRIVWYYDPAPKVSEVIYDYDQDTIYVNLD